MANALGFSLSTVRRIRAGATAGERYLGALRELYERGRVRNDPQARNRGEGEPASFARHVDFAGSGSRRYSFDLKRRSREAKAALCAQVLQDLQKLTLNEHTREKHVCFGVATPSGSRSLLRSKVGRSPAEVLVEVQGDFKGSIFAYLSDRLSRSSRYSHQHGSIITSFDMTITEPRAGHHRSR